MTRREPTAPTGALIDTLAGGASLRRRLVVRVGAVTLALLVLLVVLGNMALSRFVAGRADAALQDAAQRSTLLIERILLERSREATMLAQTPRVIDAARLAGERAAALGLGGLPIEALESRFDRPRSLEVDPRLRGYLLALAPKLEIAEAILTDDAGHNAVTTQRTSDFVQRDEAWWMRATQDGAAPPTASYDESAKQVTMAVAVAVRASDLEPPAGVLKLAFGLKQTDLALARASSIGGIDVDLLDHDGRVIASSSRGTRMQSFAGYASVEAAGADTVFAYLAGDQRRRAAATPVNGAQWKLVAHTDEATALGEYHTLRFGLFASAALLFVLVCWSLLRVGDFVTARVTRPAAELAAVAERVAAGDLSAEVAVSRGKDEVARLSRATRAMIEELRRLAAALAESSRENAAMAAEITTGVGHMATTAQDVAATSNSLSDQAQQMADHLRGLSSGAAELVVVSNELAGGANDGLTRSRGLQTLVQENRARLDENAVALRGLAGEVEANAAAADALASASEEIRAFVTFVQKMARQSKLLALNAAMEAARAGDQGDGFAVVATEVRRLAAGAAEAAARTAKVVKDVLARVEQSKESAARTVAVAHHVLGATQHGADSFRQVEDGVRETLGWATGAERAAGRARALVDEMTGRIESLSRGTEAFAAAMQQVAASSQEQSASTQQIA
ncbi:MAG TPA: methyl-accepting chemotaxis protein, partial [Gemmatimonadaceae bacterium]|nr:methyl-accepting chemotaxis protein [Gemmatimonadaceae bacterium]